MPLLDSSGGKRLAAWVAELAAARWTVLFFLLMAEAALMVAYGVADPTVLIAPPFALLLINTGAAILTRQRFRADLPLLVFHLALLVLVALIGMARLIYMEGKTTLTSGTVFEGQLITETHGPLHTASLGEVRFSNEGFTEDHSARHKLHATYNRVAWQDSAGQWQQAQIGDDHPLLIKGYKIYTSQYRGFSPVFRWQAATGTENFGTVQLPDPLDGASSPAVHFKLPDGTDAWTTLDLGAPKQVPGTTRDNLGSQNLEHVLVLHVATDRHVLRPGDQIDLREGKLTYVRLDSWMGYVLSYDPTRPWIVATILIGIASLIWFYWRKLFGPAHEAAIN